MSNISELFEAAVLEADIVFSVTVKKGNLTLWVSKGSLPELIQTSITATEVLYQEVLEQDIKNETKNLLGRIDKKMH